MLFAVFSNYRSSHQRSSVKKVLLEISQNSQENTCAKVSFLIKLQALPLINAALYLAQQLTVSNFNKRRGCLLEEIR